MAVILQNFRGKRALVVHRPDGNRRRLETHLRRLGLEVTCLVPEMDGRPLPADALEACDVLFYDADHGSGELLPQPPTGIPVIAVVGVEAPSRLARIVRLRAAAVLSKPLGSTGLFTALFTAFNEQAQRSREAAELCSLQQRLRGRRFVVKAVLRIMEQQGVDDERAFRMLRRESMRRRMTLEDLCREVLSRSDTGERPGEAAQTRQQDLTSSKEEMK